MKALLERARTTLARAAPPPRLRAAMPGLLALAVAAELFALLGPAAIDRRLAAEATQVSDELEAQDAALRARLHAAARPAAVSREIDPMAFLREVRATLTHGTADITRLVPRAHDPRTLDVELLASYPAFLELVDAVERLGARIEGVRLRPAEPATQDRDSGVARQTVSFALEVPRRLAPPPGGPALQGPIAAGRATHDPFSPPAIDDGALSRRYMLTGLTRTAGGPVATINDRDYAVGDRLGALVVTGIGGADVDLADGPRQVRLHLGRPARTRPDPSR